jgi:predicted nucleotidyltransferase component of viral defense system
MSKISPSDIAVSVRERLLNVSRKAGDPFDLVLTRYALERLLYRIGGSPFADRFILKGALLLEIWGGGVHRPTRDLDLLGYGDLSDKQIINLFQEICTTEVKPDGLVFDQDSFSVRDIREDQEYTGKRVLFFAFLAGARIRIQVDVGFGDAVAPPPEEVVYPTILNFPAPKIRAYPMESVISEKTQTVVSLGMQNSRMKDYFDIWVLSRRFSFKGASLVRAINATFDRRKTAIPQHIPIGLSEDFALDEDKNKQWNAFLSRIGFKRQTIVLSEVIKRLQEFLISPLSAAAQNKQFKQFWEAGGPWTE